jgi:ABC-2 type transport system permease protein
MSLTGRPVPQIDWLGWYTLARKEVRRFLVVWVQTLVGPLLFAVLLLLIFGVVMGQARAGAPGVDYLRFLAPGLIAMTMLQNAFANTSSSILIAKQSGTISDVLMAPLRPGELTLGYAIGGVARGVILGLALCLVFAPFTGVPASAGMGARTLAFGLGATLLFSLLGVIGGVLARRMEHIAFMSQIIVAPLTLLSGTFYSVQNAAGADARRHSLQPGVLPHRRLSQRLRRICGIQRGDRRIGTCLGAWNIGLRLQPDLSHRLRIEGIEETARFARLD